MENIKKLSPSVYKVEDENIEKRITTSNKTRSYSVKQTMMKSLLVAGLFLILIIFSTSVFALDPRVNITFQEVVYRNASFAKTFDLLEQVDSCMIEGSINITNPSSDTVTDIAIKLNNTDLLMTDFRYTAGRPSRQISGGAGVVDTYNNVDNAINSIDMDLQDMDNDGATDYFYVNRTHFVFNFSSQNGAVFGVQLRNNTMNPIDINNAGAVNVPIQMNDIAISNGTVTFGNITVNGLVTANNDLGAIDVLVEERIVGPIVIYVPELRPGNYTTVAYNISCITNEPPIRINTTYLSDIHPTINKKVLAGENWTIIQNLTTNNPAGQNVTNFQVKMRAQNVTWNGTEFNFSLGYIYQEGDSTNVTGPGTNNRNWTWSPNNGTLAFGSSSYIKYTMFAPANVPFSATYLALQEDFSYSINTLLSGINLVQVNASADIDFSFEKKIYQPADNEFSKNVTWEIIPNLNTSVNISYEVSKVTIWVTQDLNPLNDTTATMWGKLQKNYTGSPLVELNKSNSWGGSGQNWRFNYTDGSSASAPPPIVWMEPEWLIKNSYGQILNFSNARSGGDYYLKYIYVVNGYWLQIYKNVTSVGENKYQIDVLVENIGNGWTPQNEYVTVYDFIPNDFAPSDFTLEDNANQTVGQPGGAYYGRALQWNIQWKDGKNSSLGPKNGPYNVSQANYSWTLKYNVTGTGDYKASELYIVGLDPFKVDGASASPIITIIAGFQNYTNEIMYTAVVLFLIVINVANFVMTHRINNKISEKLPPVPQKKK